MNIILILLFTSLSCQVVQVEGQGSSISFIPNEPLCIGEEVIMVCFVQAPTSENFGLNTATISINGSTPGLHTAINDNTILEVDTSRYTADTAGLTTSQSRPGARLVISNYLPSDSDTTFQCSGQYPNATTFSPIPPESPMPQALPPSTPTVSSLSADCTKRLIHWTAPASDIDIEIFYVYRNSTLLAVTTDTNYTDTDQLLVNTLYQYSVIANSCAGNSTEGIATVAIKDYLTTPDFSTTQTSTVLTTVNTTHTTADTTHTTTVPTNPTDTVSSVEFLSIIIILIIIIILLISIITILVVVIVVMYRKIKQLQSPPKQTPHPYEYLDLNMVSPDTAAIPSVPKDSAYYTPMQSVGTQGNSNVVPPVYANLK